MTTIISCLYTAEDYFGVIIKKLLRPPNTDNAKGKLLVTVFAFTPAPMTIPAYRGTRTPHQYSQLYFCTLTNLWLRDNLYRDTAHVPATNFVTGDNPDSYRDAAPIIIVLRHSYSSQNLYLDGKKCAIPSLHRDRLPAKVPGHCSALSSGNTTSLYCRAVMVNSMVT
jgi:hypothetical protein